MKKFKMRGKAAFTLYELVIVMALSLLVVGLVTSYIIFSNRFTSRSEAAYERVEQFTRLREEIDTWFSFADSGNYVIIINNQDGADNQDGATEPSTLVSFKNSEENSEIGSITIATADGVSVVTFKYPENSDKNPATVSCKYISDIKFYKYEENSQAATSLDSYALRFTIETKINKDVYACEFLYEDN